MGDEVVAEQLTLREWRERRGIESQEQLETLCALTPTAQKKNIKLTQTAISAIEIARVLNPKWDTVCVLAEALNIDPRQLKFESDNEKQTRLPLKRQAS